MEAQTPRLLGRAPLSGADSAVATLPRNDGAGGRKGIRAPARTQWMAQRIAAHGGVRVLHGGHRQGNGAERAPRREPFLRADPP